MYCIITFSKKINRNETQWQRRQQGKWTNLLVLYTHTLAASGSLPICLASNYTRPSLVNDEYKNRKIRSSRQTFEINITEFLSFRFVSIQIYHLGWSLLQPFGLHKRNYHWGARKHDTPLSRLVFVYDRGSAVTRRLVSASSSLLTHVHRLLIYLFHHFSAAIFLE